MKNIFLTIIFIYCISSLSAQVVWQKVSPQYQPLPASVDVFSSGSQLNGRPNIAFYVKAKLSDKQLLFETDTSKGRRLTPQQFFEKNNEPLVVVNTTFFSFQTNSSLNTVIKDGKIVAFNDHSIPLRGKDTLVFAHPFSGTFGVKRKRKADIAYTYSDSSLKRVYALQQPQAPLRDSLDHLSPRLVKKLRARKWKMKTAIGGGPVLVQNGEVKISNKEEMKFSGAKGLSDLHPRTLIGYTNDGYIIIMAIQGRFSGEAEGASLVECANLMKELGCVEALNLDGGGSSCLLVNGKNTIIPSDKKGVQRPVPAVFLIKRK